MHVAQPVSAKKIARHRRDVHHILQSVLSLCPHCGEQVLSHERTHLFPVPYEDELFDDTEGCVEGLVLILEVCKRLRPSKDIC